jgi:Polyketide cyclase / dehydrase and lipid transport
MKRILCILLFASFGIALAQVSASYELPIMVCEAFAFITDYEGAKSFPGVVDSKVLSRSGNKVRVARLLEERILFMSIEMRSELEYVEVPNKALLFEQLSGDTKYYKGSWRLSMMHKWSQTLCCHHRWLSSLSKTLCVVSLRQWLR